ncbi:MAG: hypothetical protein KBG28_08465 [Kofleriaceae bacterium]|nr:hypothetical protein [Kofleriaceae bacterium]MBP6838307.1 hypothetical protein [Kofleriaceae bacterium]MBP9203979.1 hypothetical protein [Kofleriaceae bacterium]
MGAPGDGRAGSDTSTEADWLASEPGLVRSMVVELQRMKRRARARWPLVLALGLVLGAGLTYRMGNKPHQYTARLVLALSEGSAARRNSPLPARELRDYVFTRLLPTSKLQALIEARNLFPLRKTQGAEFGLASLYDLIELEVFRNYFLDGFQEGAPRTARIELTVRATDAAFAWRTALDLEAIIQASIAEENVRIAEAISTETDFAVDQARRRLVTLQEEASRLGQDAQAALEAGDEGRAAVLSLEAFTARTRVREANTAVGELTRQLEDDRLVGALGEAGLGLGATVVAERKPEEVPERRLRQALLAASLVVAMILVCAVAIAVFDPRIHEADDVTRLGIPVLGHVPPFAGDGVGSLRGRGVRRAHGAWWKRWL